MADGSTMDVRLLDGDNQEEQQEEELHISHPLHGDAPYWCGTLILIIMNYTVATLITGGRNIIVISHVDADWANGLPATELDSRMVEVGPLCVGSRARQLLLRL